MRLVRRNLIFTFVCVAAMPQTTSTFAQNNLPPNVREMARKVMMPVVYQVPGMDKVKVIQNLKYTKTDDPNVLMDFYLPPDATPGEKHPVVIFIHGGAKTEYTPKDWGVFTTWGRLAAACGFVGVTFTHRLRYPKSRWNLRHRMFALRSTMCGRMLANTRLTTIGWRSSVFQLADRY